MKTPLFIAPDEGRRYSIGRMSAVFKADGAETQLGYSISEWWLQPNTRGPGPHAHPDDQVAQLWTHAAARSYVLIPGGTLHDFENRGETRAGFISINVPGGFEGKMPYIFQVLTENPVGDVSA